MKANPKVGYLLADPVEFIFVLTLPNLFTPHCVVWFLLNELLFWFVVVNVRMFNEFNMSQWKNKDYSTLSIKTP